MGVAADGAASTRPFLQTGAVENVLAEDGEETGCFVHTFEANRAGWQLDQGGRAGSNRFGGRRGGFGGEGVIRHGRVGWWIKVRAEFLVGS